MVIAQKSSENRISLYKIVIIIISVFICLIALEKFTPVAMYGDATVALTNLKAHDEIQKYENYSVEIVLLTEEDLEKLSNDQLVVYEGLTPGVYQITFFSVTDKLLVIYDYKSDKIIRMFYINYL